MLASLINNHEWLQNHLPSTHPLWQSPLYLSGFINSSIKENIYSDYEFECEHTGLVATGIPNHLIVIKSISRELKNQKKIIELIPSDVVKLLNDRFVIEGVAPVNVSDFNRFKEDIFKMMQEYCNRMDVERTQTSSSSSSSSSNAEWKQWSWADRIYNKRTKEWIPDPQSRFHPVPKGWRLPNAPIANLWYAWWHGDKVLKIRPYQFISRLDISVDPSIDRGPADRLDWGRCIIVMQSTPKHG